MTSTTFLISFLSCACWIVCSMHVFVCYVCMCVLDKPYWAKDLIFLVTSHEEIGMQAWVDQYMGVVPGNSDGRGWEVQNLL